MAQQLEQMQTENQTLKNSNTKMVDTLAAINAQGGSPDEEAGPPMKMGEAGNPEGPNAIVDNARNMMGVPTGAALPT